LGLNLGQSILAKRFAKGVGFGFQFAVEFFSSVLERIVAPCPAVWRAAGYRHGKDLDQKESSWEAAGASNDDLYKIPASLSVPAHFHNL
jgi:hypothetical protein